MRQKGIEDQGQNEEEVCLLKEKTKELKERLNGPEQEEQSRTQTHQSSRQIE